MPPLATDLRKQLENVCILARDRAEEAALSALQKRAVDQAKPFGHFNDADKNARKWLRARGKQAGDVESADKTQSIDHLTQELAYEYWHRMLFARFLAENHLLINPDGVAVSLEDCEEVARDTDPPAPNGFVLAARYASRMLPQIFRTDDALLEVEFAPEQRLKLEKLLASLPQKTFVADDSLGWVYQFWQSKKKEEVNKSGAKIDGRTLSAVTQLFTEHYMVEFLLHNTIGAWWCGRNGVQGPPCGAGVSAGQSPVKLDYLRWRDDGRPAAGKFEGWPKTLAELTMLDPCCGSGHFLVVAFNLLMPLRMHDEKLTAEKACEAVLRDNLFGLELDPRCTQIAAFALALAAWKYPDAGGYRPLPPLNIACSGQGVVGSKADWVKFANGDKNFVAAMGFLYDDFLRAPTLGSLINPRAIAESIFQTGFDPLRGSLDRALRKAETQADPERSAVGVAAQGIAVAASLMARRFTLVATNVPYLARGKQDETMRTYLADVHPAAKADLATAFVERCLEYCAEGGSTALVTPQNWLFLGSYKGLRDWMLRQVKWNVVVKLGPGAFETISGEVVNVTLMILSAVEPMDGHELVGLDASGEKYSASKSNLLLTSTIKTISQSDQLLNPDARLNLDVVNVGSLLSSLAHSSHGIGTFDSLRFCRNWWEIVPDGETWVFQQSTPEQTTLYGGCSFAVRWEKGSGSLADLMAAKEAQGYTSGKWRAGVSEWGKRGVLVGQMNELPCTLY